jgi:hypothetical protein
MKLIHLLGSCVFEGGGGSGHSSHFRAVLGVCGEGVGGWVGGWGGAVNRGDVLVPKAMVRPFVVYSLMKLIHLLDSCRNQGRAHTWVGVRKRHI